MKEATFKLSSISEFNKELIEIIKKLFEGQEFTVTIEIRAKDKPPKSKSA